MSGIRVDVNGEANGAAKPRDPQPVTVVRDSKPVIVEFATPKSEPSDGEEDVIIVNEGYSKPSSKENDEAFIRNEAYSIFGKMRVEKDGSIVIADPGGPDDSSCKHFIYGRIYSANKSFNPNQLI